jgi:hypothetical protein
VRHIAHQRHGLSGLHPGFEWVLLECWAERPAKRRDWGQLRAGTSIASKIRAENKAKEEAAEGEVVPWRYQAVGARV